MTANTNAELVSTKILTRPSNYGVNQVSVGVVNSTSRVSTLASGDFTCLMLARKWRSYPYWSNNKITAVTNAGATSFITTGTYQHNVIVGSQVIINASSSATFFSSIVTTVTSTTTFGITQTSVPTDGLVFSVSPEASILQTWAGTGGTTPAATTFLGVSAPYHYFDTGSTTTSTTANPGKGVIGTSVQGKEAYYSLFMCDTTYGWRKISDFSELFVKNYGVTGTSPSTVQQMINYLPELYRKSSSGLYNQDLEDFISLFAFQYDSWRTHADRVFDATSTDLVDEKLVKLFINELGLSYEKINDIKLSRLAMQYLIKAYLSKGSTDGLKLINSILSGYPTVVASGTYEVNMIPDQNSATFNEPAAYDIWTVDATSPTTNPGVVHANAKIGGLDRMLSTPALYNFGSPYRSYPSRLIDTPSFSDNGMLVLYADASAASSGTVRIVSSPRYAIINSDVTSNIVFATYADVRAGDYVIPSSTTQALKIPYGTYVTTVNTQTAAAISLTLSTSVAGATAGSVVYLSPAGPDLVAASSKMIPITSGSSYAFSLYANAGGYQPSPIVPFIEWYKVDGTRSTSTTNIITTGPSLNVAVTATTSWNRATVVGTAPADAFYAAPGWTVVRTSTVASQAVYTFDAVQFEPGNTTTAFVKPATAILTATATAYSPLNASVVNRLNYSLKDYTTSGFMPLNVIATSYTALAISDTGTSLTAYSPTMGYNVAYPMATVTLMTGTSNIVPGMSFSISNTSVTATNQTQFGIIMGVISSSQYRIMKRSVYSTDPSDYTVVTYTSTQPNIINNFFVNTPNLPSLRFQ